MKIATSKYINHINFNSDNFKQLFQRENNLLNVNRQTTLMLFCKHNNYIFD